MDTKGKIIVVGLGPGAKDHISLETLNALKSSDKVILRTGVHPSVSELDRLNISYTTCDHCYEKSDFSEVYASIVDLCINEAQNKTIVYAVPGSPMVAEQTVVLLRKKAKEHLVQLQFLPAISFLDVVFTQLEIDPVEGLAIVDALNPESFSQKSSLPLLITQVYNSKIASDVKLTLMDNYPDEHEVVFLRNLGLPEQEVLKIPLFELDRQKDIDHLTSLYVPTLKEGKMDVSALVDTMVELRSPSGCPWDKEQDHETLRRYLVEEVYEVIDAIDKQDYKELCDELGDLLLQIVFHARIAEENDLFNMQDVVDGVVKKMHRRHPHVFGTIYVDDAQQVMENWEKIKQQEYKERKNILDGIPKSLPSLTKSYKLQAKVAKVGFDWSDIADIWDKLEEEIVELKEVIKMQSFKEIEHELGDILTTVVNLSRHIGCEPEIALNKANKRFSKRFSFVEQCVKASGKPWKDFSLQELDEFWQQAKKA